jgi:hypothetical protein
LKKKKIWVLLFIFCLTISASVPVIYKAVPYTRHRECYRSFFPNEAFQKKLQQTPPEWCYKQIQEDLHPFEDLKISANRVDLTYQKICQTLGNKIDSEYPIYHFRILDNKLYKYVGDDTSFSDTDTRTEKAIKTLLVYAKVPDMDFIFCGADGIPEHYVPDFFYCTDDPQNQAPIFAHAKRSLVASQYIVLVPDHLCLSDLWFNASQEILRANQQISWDEKLPIAIWRGGLSDTGEPTDGRFVKSYQNTPRYFLSALSLEHPDVVDAGFTGLDCKEMEDLLKQMHLWKPSISRQQHLLGKYLPVLDGHMCTYPGYQWRLLSNSVCFKQSSDQVQWFYQAIAPYEHYIPVANDMHDLMDQIEWAKQNDEKVQQIVRNAQHFVSQNLMFEDLYRYLHFSFSEYAKRQEIDFAALKRETEKDPHWKCIQYRKRLALEKSYNRVKNKFKANRNK